MIHKAFCNFLEVCNLITMTYFKITSEFQVENNVYYGFGLLTCIVLLTRHENSGINFGLNEVLSVFHVVTYLSLHIFV